MSRPVRRKREVIPGVLPIGRVPDFDRYREILHLVEVEGVPAAEIAKRYRISRDAALKCIQRARTWRTRIELERLQSSQQEPEPTQINKIEARMGELETTIARLCGVLSDHREHPAQPGASASVDLGPVAGRLDEIVKRLDHLEAGNVVSIAPATRTGNQRDQHPEIVRHQLIVCARELGAQGIVDQLDGLALTGVRKLLAGGPAPKISFDLCALDRLYVVVRMAQLDIEADDDDVIQVHRAIRARQKSEVSRKAWEEAS